MAFFRRGWPPIEFAHLCRDCRHELPWGVFNRALFLICCLALLVAITACGIGIVYLIQWLSGPPTSTL